MTEENGPGLVERNPLAVRAAVVAAVVVVLELLVILDVIKLTTEQTEFVGMAVGVIATAVVAIWSRGAVTPVTDPRNDAGERLVPESVGPVIVPRLDADTLD